MELCWIIDHTLQYTYQIKVFVFELSILTWKICRKVWSFCTKEARIRHDATMKVEMGPMEAGYEVGKICAGRMPTGTKTGPLNHISRDMETII